MFGMLRPCRNRLSPQLRTAWMAHLCGLCLALRDRHGHLARLVTNYDGLVLSALVEAQRPAVAGDEGRRRAGPCVLRGLKGAEVTQGEGARLAASASLLLASAQLRDHVEDGDLVGAVRTRAATAVAGRWDAAGEVSGAGLGLDVALVRSAVARQGELERALAATGPGADPVADLLRVTAPTEEASAEGLRATAVVAGRPANAAPLAEVGPAVRPGRPPARRRGGPRRRPRRRPVQPGARHRPGARPRCARCATTPSLGVRLALAEVELDDDALVHLLLVHELPRAVERTFTAAQQPGDPDLPPQWKTPTVRPARAAARTRPRTRRTARRPPAPPGAWPRWRPAARAGAAAATGTVDGSPRQPAAAGRAAGAATAASARATAATAAAVATADAGPRPGVSVGRWE